MKVSYVKLDADSKQEIDRRILTRTELYDAALKGRAKAAGHILIVGDKPGPGAPTAPDFLHVPFWAVKNCSGWLNALLHVENIPESELVWINSADKDGAPTDGALLKSLKPRAIIALGGNADKWLRKNGSLRHYKVHHPQYWKRFRNSEPYDLFPVLRLILDNNH